MLETLLRFCSVGALLRFCSALLRRFCQSPLSHHPLDSFPPFLISFPRPMPRAHSLNAPRMHTRIYTRAIHPRTMEWKERKSVERERGIVALFSRSTLLPIVAAKKKRKRKKKTESQTPSNKKQIEANQKKWG